MPEESPSQRLKKNPSDVFENPLPLRLLSDQWLCSPRVNSPKSSACFSRSVSRIFRESDAANKVYLIVLTGGPCAGKSTALSTLQQRLEGHGFTVFALPEVASLMFNAGANWTQFAGSEPGLALFQTELARIQIEHEQRFTDLGRSTGKPSIVICDRGLFDGKAFCTPGVWTQVLTGLNATEPELMKRYDAVVHMVTAADGADAFYNFDNPARRENLPEALEVDEKLRRCWEDHPGLTVVDNRNKPFAQKIQEVVSIIYKLVGVDPQGYVPRRFTVSVPDVRALRALFPPSVVPTEFRIMDSFFRPTLLFRQRKGANMTYFRLERDLVTVQEEKVLIERIHRLRQEEYDAHLVAGRSQEVRVLHKWVFHFELGKHQWELHFFKQTHTCYLAVETEDDGPLTMPEFLKNHLGPEIPKASGLDFEDHGMAVLHVGPEGADSSPSLKSLSTSALRLEALAESFEAEMRSPSSRVMSLPGSPNTRTGRLGGSPNTRFAER